MSVSWTRRRGVQFVVCAALSLSCAPALQAQESAARATPDKRLHALFDTYWDTLARFEPEAATYRGDLRFNDRLTDHSAAAIAERDRSMRGLLEQAKALRRDSLSPADRVSYDVFVHRLQQEVDLQAFDPYRALSLRPVSGFHMQLSNLLRDVPVGKREHVEQLLARMAAFPKRVDQEIERLRPGIARGWVPPKSVVERVLTQIDGQLAAEPHAGPFYEPFARLPDSLGTERDALRERGRRTIAEQVLPAVRKLRQFVANEYLPAAPAEGGLSRYPDGERIYTLVARQQTTTPLPPREIHAIGLAQVAKLRTQMEDVMRETRFDGDYAAFVNYLNSDPKFFHTSAEALLAAYRDIAKRIDPELPKLFAELPRAPYGIRPMPLHAGPGAADNYTSPALDGSRPGWFNANVAGLKRRPTWTLETLVAHETVPGHHLQSARARELQGLPAFRRASGYVAYGEGWALYAETLGPELGLYADPYSRFGHLQAQMFRAVRLVVDTGLHALGWTRQQAIDYMLANTGQDPVFVTAEIDRYLAMPGQALGYMIGKLKFDELRARAQTKLGARFDIRRFHQVVLDQGALPLDVLERVVDDWLAAGGR